MQLELWALADLHRTRTALRARLYPCVLLAVLSRSVMAGKAGATVALHYLHRNLPCRQVMPRSGFVLSRGAQRSFVRQLSHALCNQSFGQKWCRMTRVEIAPRFESIQTRACGGRQFAPPERSGTRRHHQPGNPAVIGGMPSPFNSKSNRVGKKNATLDAASPGLITDDIFRKQGGADRRSQLGGLCR